MYLSVLVVCHRLHCAGEMDEYVFSSSSRLPPLFGGVGGLLLVFMIEALHLVLMVDLKNKNKIFSKFFFFFLNSETPFSVYCKCHYKHLYSSLSDIIHISVLSY